MLELEERVIPTIGADPDVNLLSTCFWDDINDLATWNRQAEENKSTRHALWANQSHDQKKRGGDDSPAFPWPGASDLRIFASDEVINTVAAQWVNALMSAEIQAVGVEHSDMRTARLVSNAMVWLRNQRLVELRREATIAAQQVLESGAVVVKTYWKRDVNRGYKEISLEALAQDPQMAGAIEALQAGNIDGFVDVLDDLTPPDIPKKVIRKFAKDLTKSGAGKLPFKEVTQDRPCVKTLVIGEDVILPMTSTDPHDIDRIHEIHYLSKSQLESKVQDEGWDEDAVVEAIEQGPQGKYRFQIERINDRFEQGDEDLYTFVTSSVFDLDELGVPQLSMTTYSPDSADGESSGLILNQVLPNFKPLQQPYDLITRETLTRQLLDSRGLPEIHFGQQAVMKFQRDNRIDRATFATLPPRTQPATRRIKEWGPGVEVNERRPGEYRFLEPPAYDPGSQEIDETTWDDMRRYSGLSVNNERVDPNELRSVRQAGINSFLEGWQRIFRKVWSMWRQYGNPQEIFHVAGAQFQLPENPALDAYDFYLSFDALNDDADAKQSRIETVTNLAASVDRENLTDWGELYRYALESVSPVLAERIVQPKETAQQKEIEETKRDFESMWAGMDIDLPQNVNTQLRTQMLSQWLQGSETIPATDVQKRI